jgi:hypothetical protein
MKIGLIPLDERPVNVRYPRMLAACAGVELTLPPPEALSQFREPANTADLLDWLEGEGGQCDLLIVSCETLGYGGLITSRISHETAGVIAARLERLRDLKAHRPEQVIYGFNLITRISRANDATEEPEYWADHGADLYRYSQLLDKRGQGQGQEISAELDALQTSLPRAFRDDFIQRRLRNHTVNLHVLGLVADGVIDRLTLSSDDTSTYGLGSREKGGLTEWATLLGLGERLLLYPGADEVGSVLVARAINDQHKGRPRFQVDYAVPGGEAITAAFEDSAVRITVERQISAAGGQIVERDADLYLLVNPPRSSTADWPQPYTEAELVARLPHLGAAAERLQRAMERGQVIALADVAHANGADTTLMELLRERGLLPGLHAYSAWNTAGNTIGTTIAHAAIAWRAGRDSLASRQFRAHHLIEDWLYQGVVRQGAYAWLLKQTGTDRIPPGQVAEAARWIEAQLAPLVTALDTGFRVVPGSLRLPWKRLFEIDFDLEPA